MTLGEAVDYICRELGVPFDKALWLDEDEADGPVSDAPEAPDRADAPDGLDRALDLASHCGDGDWPAGSSKPRPP
jgi:hypothetical protein